MGALKEPILWQIFTTIFLAGVAWGAVKYALNGTRHRVKEIHERLHTHINEENRADIVTHDRLARLETKVDLLISTQKGT